MTGQNDIVQFRRDFGTPVTVRASSRSGAASDTTLRSALEPPVAAADRDDLRAETLDVLDDLPIPAAPTVSIVTPNRYQS